METIRRAIDLAFSGDVNEMGQEIQSALIQKVSSAMDDKKIEVSQYFMTQPNESQDIEEDKRLSSKESYVEEKLSVSDGVDSWINDFVHSEDPKFAGKSKKERIKMALGAFYSAKKGTNEEVEETNESAPSAGLSTKEKSSVVKKAKAGKDIGKTGKGFGNVVANAKKYGAKDPEAVAAAAMWKNIKRK